MFGKSVTSFEDITPKNKNWFFLLILTLMSMAGLIGSDLYLPVLPEMGLSLHKDTVAMQATLGIYLFGLSFGQLILGPLTDHYGRKRLLVLGMMIYFFASLSCAFSFSYYQILISRLFQAFGASSGLVIGRAMIGDLYEVKEAGKIFSTIFPFVGMSPAISPVIGGLIGHYFGWEMTFVFIALFALTIAFLAYFYLFETLPVSNTKSLQMSKIISTFSKILRSKEFLFYASAPCVAYIAYFSYIAQSPFIFHARGFTEHQIGMFYITLSLTYVAGNLMGRKLLKSCHIDLIIRYGYYYFSMGAILLFFAEFSQFSLLIMVFSISILTFGNGFLIPLGTAGVVSSFPNDAGYASGLLGFLQLGLAGLSSSIIGSITQNSINRLGIYIILISILGFLIHWVIKFKK